MELTILDWIQTLRSPFLDQLMPMISFLGDNGYVWILLTCILLCFKKTRKIGIVLLIALIVDLLLCNVVLKPLVGRTRPFEIKQFYDLLVDKPLDYSFPSGHTAASFTVVFSLFFAKERKYLIPVLVLSCLIAFSRMYLYVHYPTDILGGIFLGILNGFLGNFFVEWWIKQKNNEEIIS